MADAFDQFLEASLSPPERLPDRRFVAGVQARIMLEDQLARERHWLVASLAMQLAALVAVAAAIWVIGSAAPVAEWIAESPGFGLIVVIAAFGFAVAMFSRSERQAAY